jgi:CRP-like cAMP-binding protein
VPNSAVSKETITNYSEPTPDTRVEVEVSASYDASPNEVKSVIRAAIADEPLLTPGHEPEVLIGNFADSAVTYRIRVWTSDFSSEERLRDRIRAAVYYAFRRAAIEIPFPHQVQIERVERAAPPAVEGTTLAAVEIFSALSDAERASLAGAARRCVYGAGERVVRQGDAGSSMFVVLKGEASVVLGAGQEVARIGPGGFFGEMSLLTGAPRTATVTTTVDSDLLEITAEAFRQFVLANPTAVEAIGAAVARRAEELDRHRAAGAPSAHAEPPHSFLARVRRFLHVT